MGKGGKGWGVTFPRICLLRAVCRHTVGRSAHGEGLLIVLCMQVGMEEQSIMGSLNLRLENVLQTESNHFRDDENEVHRQMCLGHEHIVNWSLIIPPSPRASLCVIPRATWDSCI